jgi:hypothetical protein
VCAAVEMQQSTKVGLLFTLKTAKTLGLS